MSNFSRESIKNILPLNSEGNLVDAKNYSDELPTQSARLGFEKSVFTETQKTEGGGVTLRRRREEAEICAEVDATGHVELKKTNKRQKKDTAYFRSLLGDGIAGKFPRTSEEAVLKLGSVVSGVVERLIPIAVIVKVNYKGFSEGIILTEHLADHQGHTTLMKSVLKPGHEFDQLVVLDVKGSILMLTAKLSLINSATELPSDIAQIHTNSTVHGYVCNLIQGGCFVRFLGKFTGFSPKHEAVDDNRIHISEAFDIGQSVRSHIKAVNSDTSRVTLTLKQSSCFSTDTSFIQGYFLQEDKIAKLQMVDSKITDFKWVENFNIGSIVEGVIHETKEFGFVIRFEQHTDVFGFITHYQLGGTSCERGSIVRAVVLDINKSERLVDLSLKPEMVCRVKEDGGDNKASKKKRKRDSSMDMELHRTVNAIVELVKENYLVLSIPDSNHAIGYASIADYNTQKLPNKHFVNGQSVVATVGDLPSSSLTGRLLLLLKSLEEGVETSSSERAKNNSSYNVGSLVKAKVTEVKPLELRLEFGVNFHGRVHITEASDDHILGGAFSKFKVGRVLTARIVGKRKYGPSEKKSKKTLWELSIRPSLISGPKEIEDKLMIEESDFSIGKRITGYVVGVDGDWVRLTVSRGVMAKLFFLDSATEPSELGDIQKRFPIGKAVTGHILSVHKEKKLLRLTLHPLSCVSSGTLVHDALESVIEYIREGDVGLGKIRKIFPDAGGLLVQIGPHLFQKAHFTELTDSWTPNPLLGYQEGQIIKYKVLEVDRSRKGFTRIDLLLRASLQKIETQDTSELNTDADSSNKRVERIEELHPGMDVQGYVKNLTPKGCFIMLSRKVDAEILLANLSDGFIENLEMEFPVGKLVNGKVLSVEPLSQRVVVTLKTGSQNRSSKSDVGEDCSNEVCPFIEEAESGASVLPLEITHDGVDDSRLDNIENGIMEHVHEENLNTEKNKRHIKKKTKKERSASEQRLLMKDIPRTADEFERRTVPYRVGDKVKAKILKVYPERHRISLGMKNLIVRDDVDNDASVDLVSNQDSGEATDSDGSQTLQEDDIPGDLSVDEDSTNEVWLRQVQNLLEQGKDGSQGIVERALLCLPRHKHIKFISQCAILEFKFGVPDRGRSMFEKMLQENHQRTDLWSVYLDQEIRLGEADLIRALFERATSLRLPAKNMKLLIKKYLDYEKSCGEEGRVEYVKEKAMEFVNSSLEEVLSNFSW